MKSVKILSIVIIALACAFVLIACSNAKSPVSPATDDSSSITNDLPESLNADVHSRSLLAAYDAVIDPAAKTFTITPIERSTQYHFPLTQLNSSVVQITGYGWTPNFWADIKLVHPLPAPGIDGFDPRVIAILPANPGVRFDYPETGVSGNNSVLLEPDGYTKLFDNLGGSIPGNVNPFKAYFKNEPNRIWSSTGLTEETQRWQMNIAGFGGPLQFKLVVDVSTNYPNPPQPVIDNAQEPVKIDATVEPGLTSIGGSAEINVTLLDWQGQAGIEGVQVEAPDLFNNTVTLSYSGSGPNPDEYIYTGTISNSLLAPEGEYNILVSSWDQATGIYIYNEFKANVINTGNLIWAKSVEGSYLSYGDCGWGITTLSDNSTVVTGRFYGTATFGAGEPNQIILNSAGWEDIFIARYNQDGTLAWAKRAGGPGGAEGYGITTLSDDSTVITGIFWDPTTFGPGELNETILTPPNFSYDIFIARYNPNGTLSWAKRSGGLNTDFGFGIATLSDDSTVVTGLFEGSATFGPDEINQTVLTSSGDADIFIARYNPDGTLAWVKRAGGVELDRGNAITTLSDNSIVVTGWFEGTATFGQGEINQTVLTSEGDMDIFIARYNPDGTLAWVNHAGGPNLDRGDGITTLSDNSTIVTGWFFGAATFGSGEPNHTILTTAGGLDIFVSRYNPNGTLAWAKSAGGLGTDYGQGIKTLSDNSIVVTGDFSDSATFGSGEINQTVLTSVGLEDIFIARYNPNGTLAWAKSAGGSAFDEGFGITTLSDNSSVVTGFFSETATFGEWEANETILTSAGNWDIFIARFEP